MTAIPTNVDNFQVTRPEIDEIYTLYEVVCKGHLPKTKFRKIIQKFFDFTIDAYITGMGPLSRGEAMCAFEQYLKRYYKIGKPCSESTKIFNAVDLWHPYT